MNALMSRMFANALLLTVAHGAGAVHLDPGGRGQVLIYPYYSAQEGTQTLLSIVNHQNAGKAVKLRLREARNGREVATLNIYLAEFDVWSAALFMAPDGAPGLLTEDTTCSVPEVRTSSTLPRLPNGRRYLPLSNERYTGAMLDGGPTALSRAAVGHIEVIEMGSLVDNSDSDIHATPVNGVPVGCRALVSAWEDTGSPGYWRANPAVDLLPPTGGLSGTVTLLKIGDGTAWSLPVTAIDGFSVVQQHSAPNAVTPDLSSAVTETARIKVESSVLFKGRLLRSEWPQARAIDAVSAVLAQGTIRAEYSNEAAIGARTDWVLTLPTRRFYSDPAITAVALAPFTVLHDRPQRCEVVRPQPYNRESTRPLDFIGFPGVSEPGTCICDTSQVLPFGGEVDPAALLATLCQQNPLPTILSGFLLDAGFFALHLERNGHRSRPALGGETYAGLPILGFTLQSYRNAAARPGEIGVYSVARPHSGDVHCERDGVACVTR